MTAGVGSSRSPLRSREGTHARVRTSITHRSSTRRDRPGVRYRWRPGDRPGAGGAARCPAAVAGRGGGGGHRLPRPGPLRPRGQHRGRRDRSAQRLLPDHGEDHGRSGDAVPAEAAGHHRGVRLAAVRDGGDAHQRARGLGDRLVRPRAVDARGEQASVSRSTVSRICAQIKTEFEAWSRRPLDDVTLDYLFLDASHFRYHANAAAEPVLAGWGIDTDGQPVFVGLGTAASESGDAWGGFLTDLGARGLRCPLLVISDGATGLISAVERTMSGALRQRCLLHRARNILAKVPKNAQAGVKADYWAIFEVPDTVEPGPAAVRHVQN